MRKIYSLSLSEVKRLIQEQFPQWATLEIVPVVQSGWDNRTFRLGNELLIRMPSAQKYANQVEKEQKWLPRLAPYLPLKIPTVVAKGAPGEGYPWSWSIYGWLEGEPVVVAAQLDLESIAYDLAVFLRALQQIDATQGPAAGADNFYRGGALSVYDEQVHHALACLKDKTDTVIAHRIWVDACASAWKHSPVWVHGDISRGNLLVQAGRLAAVIDFGQLAVGDPACDLAIAWTLFKGGSRTVFRRTLQLDDDTWLRGKAWALWKTVIVAGGLVQSNAAEALDSWQIIKEVLEDSKG